MMSVIAFSLPEAIILRKVLKPRIIMVGYLFNLLMEGIVSPIFP
ncbi:MAG: hypothetical protein NTZ01_01940 [Verrucomicrobia bacterium]|nr:hypothetical protein [Verrucomicrobiota bacterium]